MIGRSTSRALGFGTASASLILAACVTVPPAEPAPSAKPQTFICDRSDGFTIAFQTVGARMMVGGATVSLASQPVGSGFAYSGGGHSLRGKGMELTWTKPDGTVRTCREQEWAMQQPQIQPPMAELGGSRWTLIAFQSSDDTIGKIIPPNLERYTLEFGTDGRLSAQLDCNRANATWQATPSSASGGSLDIKGGMMTRAMCGPGAIDSRMAADLGRIRSYTMRGDYLSLALEADSGIYEFRRN